MIPGRYYGPGELSKEFVEIQLKFQTEEWRGLRLVGEEAKLARENVGGWIDNLAVNVMIRKPEEIKQIHLRFPVK